MVAHPHREAHVRWPVHRDLAGDLIGDLLGVAEDLVYVSFALEAKCYAVADVSAQTRMGTIRALYLAHLPERSETMGIQTVRGTRWLSGGVLCPSGR